MYVIATLRKEVIKKGRGKGRKECREEGIAPMHIECTLRPIV